MIFLRHTPGFRLKFGCGAVALVFLFLLSGCSSQTVITIPHLDPEEAGREALAEYDTNKDGFLDADEVKRCPALLGSLKAMDKDGDGRLSAEEIALRVAEMRDSQVGLLRLPCLVTLDGQPLAGATVTLLPESFMGPALKAASGVSDNAGSVRLQVEGQPVSGTQLGFFRITVSKKEGDRETLPARYNTTTTLGQQVAPDLQGGILLRLVKDP
jgi:hypothetical protein